MRRSGNLMLYLSKKREDVCLAQLAECALLFDMIYTAEAGCFGSLYTSLF